VSRPTNLAERHDMGLTNMVSYLLLRLTIRYQYISLRLMLSYLSDCLGQKGINSSTSYYTDLPLLQDTRLNDQDQFIRQ